jgi:2-iminobutanoate/2-iminopropanoate deaminase
MPDVVATAGAPSPVGAYAQAVRHAGVVYVSGQLPIDPTTGELVGSDAEAQTRQVLTNAVAILAAAGSGADLVLKATVYLTSRDDWAAMDRVFGEYFGVGKVARSAVPVMELAFGALVEIDVVAAVGSDAR